jgi:predicted dehydrogenase/threonine dehydrogenase-like Zn-dependent dehydrogenase
VKQILQSARTGELELAEVPAPVAGPGQVLVRTHFSVVSPGTEAMAVSFARSSLWAKARSRPDLVRQVARKLRQEGPLATWQTVTTRLDAPQPLGYSCAGVVAAVGEGVTGFAPGDRVACAGAGYANHAEWNAVPENLVARVPEGVSLRDAAYATVGAIALQGLRLARPTLGETAAVVGLGLIGQLAVQCLRANGCRVLGLDPNPERVKQAIDQGAEWGAAPGALGDDWKLRETAGHGVDLALVTASSASAAPLATAAELCRRRGRISLVGGVPIELDRRLLYEKELEFVVSMSYGPGRYDRRYEELGLDFPLPFVRWTENRNLQAFLQLVAAGSVDPGRLDAEAVAFAEAESVYRELASGERRSLSIAFEYATGGEPERSLRLAPAPRAPMAGALGIAFLGAGNYAKAVLLPALRGCGAIRRVAVATATGGSARRSAERFGFESCGTDPSAALSRPEVGLVFVATRHDSHAALAAAALRAGKAVWLEKPVGLSPDELELVLSAARETGGFLAVGYNRRFSVHTRAAREALAGRQGPLALHYAVAAGPTPAGTWITDPRAGGGRIVGEVCHFVDLCAQLVGSPPVSVFARQLGRDPELDDSTVALLGFADGSTATIEYLSRAAPGLAKERFEASADGRSVRCENFRITRVAGGRTLRTWNQDKGQAAAVAVVVDAVRRGSPSPFDLDEIAAVSRATFAILDSCRSGRCVELGP